MLIPLKYTNLDSLQKTNIKNSLMISILIVTSNLCYSQVADTVFLNSKVYNSDLRNFSQAFAIKKGKFLHVGTNAQVQKYIGKNTQILDGKGKLALPSFFDSHLHFLDIIWSRKGCSLDNKPLGTKEVITNIKNCIKKQNTQRILLVKNWNYSHTAKRHKELINELNKLKLGLPILLVGSDQLHYSGNSQLLSLVNNKNSLGVFGFESLKDLSGYEKELFFKPNIEEAKSLIAELNSQGITSVLDAFVIYKHLDFYEKLFREPDATLNFNMALHPYFSKEELGSTKLLGSHLNAITMLRKKYSKESKMTLSSLKIVLDGSLEGNPYSKPVTYPTAAVKNPYFSPHIDTHGDLTYDLQKDKKGVLLYTEGELKSLITMANKEKLSTHIHVMGNRSYKVLIDIFESIGDLKAPHSLAHVQFADIEDVKRAGKLGLFQTMTYSWIDTDLEYDSLVFPFVSKFKTVRDLYKGSSHIFKSSYPVKNFQHFGGTLTFGSDAPVESNKISPFLNIYHALKRRSPKKKISLNTKESIDIYDAVDSLTINGARLVRQAHRTGSITKGKDADFLLVDRDIFQLYKTQKFELIAKTKILKTFYRGKLVFNQVDTHSQDGKH